MMRPCNVNQNAAGCWLWWFPIGTSGKIVQKLLSESLFLLPAQIGVQVQHDSINVQKSLLSRAAVTALITNNIFSARDRK